MARIKLQRVKHAGDILRAGELRVPENPTGRCGPEQVGRRTTYGHKNKRQGGIDRSGNKKTRLEQDVQRDLWTRDYLEEHNKRKRKREKEMEAKYEETGGEIHGSVHGGSVRDGQFMG